MSDDPQSSTAVEKAAAKGGSPLQIHVVNWPVRDHRNRSILLGVGILLIAIFTGMLSTSVVMGLLVGCALTIASWRYWLPVSYEIGPYGIRQIVFKRIQRISWRQFSRIEFRPQGIRFFPDHDPAQLANLRALYICHPKQDETLKQVVTYYMESLQPASTTSRPTAH